MFLAFFFAISHAKSIKYIQTNCENNNVLDQMVIHYRTNGYDAVNYSGQGMFLDVQPDGKVTMSMADMRITMQINGNYYPNANNQNRITPFKLKLGNNSVDGKVLISYKGMTPDGLRKFYEEFWVNGVLVSKSLTEINADNEIVSMKVEDLFGCFCITRQ